MKPLFPALLLLAGIEAAAQNYVTLYSDCNFKGRSQMFLPGRYSLNGSTVGAANLSSVKVPNGLKLILYSSPDPGGGDKLRINNDVSCLSSQGWNDKAMSLVVEQEGYVSNLPGNNPVPAGNAVTLFEDCNYKGNSRILGAGYHDQYSLGIGNKSLSSLQLPPGWSITLYDNPGFSGRNITYNSTISCLPRDWNDRVSSVFISRNGNNNNNNNNNYEPAYGVTLYQDCNYRGQNRTLTPGYYNWNQLGIDNDMLSSLRIPAGYSVILYKDPNFSGRSLAYSNDVSCLTSDWNDQVSSIQISASNNNPGNNNFVTIYEDENFRGPSLTLREGSYDYLPRFGFRDNALSSLQLPSGWRVVLYDQPGFKGNSYTVLRSKDKFNFSGWGDRASSMIIYTTGGSY